MLCFCFSFVCFCLDTTNTLKLLDFTSPNVTLVGLYVTLMGNAVTLMGKDVTTMGQTVTDVGLVLKDDKRELKKHAATIHCSNSLSLLQRKVSNALLYHAYKELMQKEEHEISIKQLCRLIGYNGHNHAAIRDALKGLISTVIEWNVVSDVTGTENWTASSIIASVSLEGPTCYYAYSPRMKQLLHSPSMFGKIDLVIQSRFRSSYGLALYENCIRYRGLAFTKWFDMETFKKLMGVPVEMYDVFRDFKRRVLDKAIAEVNTYSDLIIASDFIKEGRKVVKVRFSLKDRAKRTRLGKIPEDDSFAVTLKDEFGLSVEQVKKLLKQYTPAVIQEKMTVVYASKPYQSGKIQNMAGYLLSALKNDYQAAKSVSGELINLESEKQSREINEWVACIEAVKNQYHQTRETEIDQALLQLTPDEQADFITRFKEIESKAISSVLRLQRKKYSRDNVMEAPQIKALYRQFAVRELDFLQLTTLEEFIAAQNDVVLENWQKLKSFNPDHPLLRVSE